MIARLLKLNVGLVLFGVGLWLGLVAELGVGPWDVLTGGLSQQTGVRFGLMAIVVSVVVLLVGIAARVRPGIGTLLNVFVIGAVLDLLLTSPLLADLGDRPLPLRLSATLLGIATVAAGSALYLGAHLGPGPRDGLMVAIHQRTGWRVGTARAVLECVVLVLGVLLGGPVGIGTVLFALGIGPAVQVAFRVLRQTPVRRPVEVPA
ncbi:membrane protein [soil metagenome]